MVSVWFGVIPPSLDQLEPLDEIGAPGAILATPDARGAMEALAMDPALENTRKALPKSSTPAIVLSRDGLQLTSRDRLRSGDQLDALVALGTALSAAVRRT